MCTFNVCLLLVSAPSNWSYCPDCIHQTSVYKMRLNLIKHDCATAALLGYRVMSCILLFNLGYQGWTGKRPRGADTHQTRWPGLLLPHSLLQMVVFEQQTGFFLNEGAS